MIKIKYIVLQNYCISIYYFSHADKNIKNSFFKLLKIFLRSRIYKSKLKHYKGSEEKSVSVSLHDNVDDFIYRITITNISVNV